MIDSRSNYKQTWDNLAASLEEASWAVAGHTDEAELDRTGLNTVERLEQLVGINSSDTTLSQGFK